MAFWAMKRLDGWSVERQTAWTPIISLPASMTDRELLH